MLGIVMQVLPFVIKKQGSSIKTPTCEVHKAVLIRGSGMTHNNPEAWQHFCDTLWYKTPYK